jgi:hypothetical protein
MWQEASILGDASPEQLATRAAETLRLTGLLALSREQGIELLERSVQVQGASGLIGIGDRHQVFRRAEQVYGKGTSARVGEASTIDPPISVERTTGYVAGLLCDLLKLPREQFEDETSLAAYGLDSILITAFNRRIEKDLPGVSNIAF